jgi:hypothetical protein
MNISNFSNFLNRQGFSETSEKTFLIKLIRWGKLGECNLRSKICSPNQKQDGFSIKNFRTPQKSRLGSSLIGPKNNQ